MSWEASWTAAPPPRVRPNCWNLLAAAQVPDVLPKFFRNGPWKTCGSSWRRQPGPKMAEPQEDIAQHHGWRLLQTKICNSKKQRTADSWHITLTSCELMFIAPKFPKYQCVWVVFWPITNHRITTIIYSQCASFNVVQRLRSPMEALGLDYQWMFQILKISGGLFVSQNHRSSLISGRGRPWGSLPNMERWESPGSTWGWKNVKEIPPKP